MHLRKIISALTLRVFEPFFARPFSRVCRLQVYYIRNRLLATVLVRGFDTHHMRELAVVCRFLPAVRIKICNKIPKSSARRPVLQLLRKNGVRVISGSLGECSVFSLLPHHMRSRSIVISYGALNGCQPGPRISASVLNGINVNGSSLTIASSFNSTFKAVRDCMLQLLGPLPGIFNLHFNM